MQSRGHLCRLTPLGAFCSAQGAVLTYFPASYLCAFPLTSLSDASTRKINRSIPIPHPGSRRVDVHTTTHVRQRGDQ
jgi:hypothetical protein